MNIILLDALIGNDYSVCLANALKDEGIDLTFVVPSNREFKSRYDFKVKKWMPSKDQSQSIISKLFAYPVFLMKATGLILGNRNTVVHFQFFRFKTDIFFLIFLSLMGVKTVYTAHNVFPHEKKKTDKILNYLLYKSARRIIIHSETIKKKLLDNFRLNPRKISVVPHGNFDIYIPENLPSQNESRKIFNLTPDNKVLLFFGYIKEYKGLDLLLKAFRILTERGNDIHLIVAGFPETKKLWEGYAEIIDSIRNKQKIILNLNFIPSNEIALYFSAADFVVLPYKRIDHSGIIHLAYSFSKPVIATSVGDFCENIEEGKSGYLVDSQDEQALASKIEIAFQNRKRIPEMNDYIKLLNRTKYSWKEAARKTVKVYESI